MVKSHHMGANIVARAWMAQQLRHNQESSDLRGGLRFNCFGGLSHMVCSRIDHVTIGNALHTLHSIHVTQRRLWCGTIQIRLRDPETCKNEGPLKWYHTQPHPFQCKFVWAQHTTFDLLSRPLCYHCFALAFIPLAIPKSISISMCQTNECSYSCKVVT